jgi:hypothetical protein
LTTLIFIDIYHENIEHNTLYEIDSTLQNKLFNTLIQNKQIPYVEEELEPSKKPNNNKEPKGECIKEFLITKDMLSKTQNNVFNNENFHHYPNEINDKNANIQGIYDDVSGYSST